MKNSPDGQTCLCQLLPWLPKLPLGPASTLQFRLRLRPKLDPRRDCQIVRDTKQPEALRLHLLIRNRRGGTDRPSTLAQGGDHSLRDPQLGFRTILWSPGCTCPRCVQSRRTSKVAKLSIRRCGDCGWSWWGSRARLYGTDKAIRRALLMHCRVVRG